MIGDNLFFLSRARKSEDVDLPGFHLHPLKGEMKGLWAVTVRANWRVTFRIKEGEACDVSLVDYH
jgi:proteic killer suppression protein